MLVVTGYENTEHPLLGGPGNPVQIDEMEKAMDKITNLNLDLKKYMDMGGGEKIAHFIPKMYGFIHLLTKMLNKKIMQFDS